MTKKQPGMYRYTPATTTKKVDRVGNKTIGGFRTRKGVKPATSISKLQWRAKLEWSSTNGTGTVLNATEVQDLCDLLDFLYKKLKK